MSIDLSKLESVRTSGNKTIARCPACAEMGQDRKGYHLVVSNDGKFACVIFRGESGHDHRKHIFRLVGPKETPKTTVSVKRASQASHDAPEIIMDDVLGRIGRAFLSRPKKQDSKASDAFVTTVTAQRLDQAGDNSADLKIRCYHCEDYTLHIEQPSDYADLRLYACDEVWPNRI